MARTDPLGALGSSSFLRLLCLEIEVPKLKLVLAFGRGGLAHRAYRANPQWALFSDKKKNVLHLKFK